MNTVFQKQQYNGFGLNDTLMSKIAFSGVVRISEKELTIKPRPDGKELRYWVIRDEFGSRFSCFNEELAEKIVFGEVYIFRGEVKIGKGGTFMNLKSAEVFDGSEFAAK